MNEIRYVQDGDDWRPETEREYWRRMKSEARQRAHAESRERWARGEIDRMQKPDVWRNSSRLDRFAAGAWILYALLWLIGYQSGGESFSGPIYATLWIGGAWLVLKGVGFCWRGY